jgi:hypothetical protein
MSKIKNYDRALYESIEIGCARLLILIDLFNSDKS